MLIPAHLMPGENGPALTGHYLEARTAAIFAGACHANGERTLEGREALCAWIFDSGARVVLLLAAEENLSEPGVRWNARLFVDGPDSARALTFLRAREPRLLPPELEALPLEITARVDGDAYELAGADIFGLAGRALENRECCKMPLSVWYEPLARVEGRVVGDNTRFWVHDAALQRRFSRPGDNAAFVARFR
jgi:hypothetical protein